MSLDYSNHGVSRLANNGCWIDWSNYFLGLKDVADVVAVVEGGEVENGDDDDGC